MKSTSIKKSVAPSREADSEKSFANRHGRQLIKALPKLLALATIISLQLLGSSSYDNNRVCGQERSIPDRSLPDQVLPPELFEELFRDEDDESRSTFERLLSEFNSVDRDRELSRYEKIHRSELKKFEPLFREARQSTVRIESEGKILAYATVVGADGWLVSKASELGSLDEVTCHFYDGTQFRGQVVLAREDHDLVLIHVDADGLVVAPWSDEPIEVGSLVAVSDETGRPFASGVVSVALRVLLEEQQAVLGVYPEPGTRGIVVRNVERGSAAILAGLRPGDEILKLDEQPISTVVDLTNHIRRKRPGQRMEVIFSRNGETRRAVATLKGRDVSGRFSTEESQPSRFSSEASDRNSEFPEVLQHDAHLWPEQCGGPLVDLDGKVIGVNIARGGRIESYAIPASVLKTVLDQMLSEARQSLEVPVGN